MIRDSDAIEGREGEYKYLLGHLALLLGALNGLLLHLYSCQSQPTVLCNSGTLIEEVHEADSKAIV